MHSAARALIGVSLICAVLLHGCATASSSVVGGPRMERTTVTEIIVRYEPEAPTSSESREPWGIQCVSSAYRHNLRRGRGIGGRMRVVRIEPPVSQTVAQVIALQMSKCPYVDWAEADTVQFTIP